MSKERDDWLRDTPRGSDLEYTGGNCLILLVSLGALVSGAGYGLVELIRWLV